MEVKKIGVLGAGTMGAGIAQICAESGYNVILVDIAPEIVEKAMKGINKTWNKAVEKGKQTQENVAKFNTLISSSSNTADFKDCDFIIEAIIEEINVKKKVFKSLDEICKPDCVLATNTSALSITEIAAATKRADKVVGMHFFNPVPAMKLVEIIPGAVTSKAVIDATVDLTKKISKEPVECKEAPGFIVNRILVPYINEAAMVFQEGIGSAEDIDKAMKLGAGMPMGPLALADLVGIDIVLHVVEYFTEEFGDSKYRPAVILKQKVRAGHLGMKTGKGFYEYNK